MKDIPLWITELEADDLVFIKRFILASGSLKEMANVYNVSYPTVRARLNQIIGKVRMGEEKQDDHYERLIKRLAIEGKVDFEAATLLIREYRDKKEEL